MKPLNNSFRQLQIGDPSTSIFGATSTKILHTVRQNLLKRANKLLIDSLTNQPQSDLDLMARQFHKSHRQTSRHNFPRSTFVSGITNLSKIIAEEQAGVTWTIVCIMQQEDGWELISSNLRNVNIDAADVLELMECLLCFDAWTRRSTYWAAYDNDTPNHVDESIRAMMQMVQERLPCDTGNGWNLPGFHSLLHLVNEIVAFGSPSNSSAERRECSHVAFAKRPGRRSQKRYLTFERQVATRITDTVLINHGFKTWSGNDFGQQSDVPKTIVANDNSDNDLSIVKGTKWQIRRQDGRPPAVYWKTRTPIQQMRWPPRMARWILDAYDVNKICGFTEVALNANTAVRCHPGYQGGEAVYDWVMAKIVGSDDPVPAQVFAVVNHNNFIGSQNFDLVVRLARERSNGDSVLFTKWKVDLIFSVIRVSAVVSKVFVVKSTDTQICVMMPMDQWHSCFTNM